MEGVVLSLAQWQNVSCSRGADLTGKGWQKADVAQEGNALQNSHVPHTLASAPPCPFGVATVLSFTSRLTRGGISCGRVGVWCVAR